jgi:ATP adenylyltransferase
MKRDRDATDFRAVRAAYQHMEAGCPFCSTGDKMILLQNSLAVVVRDQYPVSEWHLLIIPKRHTTDYFDLGCAEVRACQQLLAEARNFVVTQDSTVLGFNVGVAGQTVMHTHIHLIPRREGDNPNPRGGVRGVIPGRADY